VSEGLEKLNRAPRDEACAVLLSCCGAARWAAQMADARPFAGVAELLERAEQIWWNLSESDWLEAFAAHPKIGERHAAQTAQAARWSQGEQSGMKSAADDTRAALAEANLLYEQRFGYIYIVCATGKSAEEMLSLCRHRLTNDAAAEIRAAAEEQRKITAIRLRKLL
jgi:OHCU decarboxylase